MGRLVTGRPLIDEGWFDTAIGVAAGRHAIERAKAKPKKQAALDFTQLFYTMWTELAVSPAAAGSNSMGGR